MSRLDAWSRRKARVAEAEAAEARLAEHAAVEAATAEKSDAEICADLGLPDPDTLTPGDDFAAFLKKNVPERLRRRALRVLWRTNPALANVDGLVDYGEDFTMGTNAGEVLATAYQVGKGFVAKVVAPEADSHDILAEPASVKQIAPEKAEVFEEEVFEEPLAIPAPASSGEDTPEEVAPIRRRMRFEFTDQEMNT